MNIYIFRKLSHTSHRGRTETSLDTFGHLLPAPSTQLAPSTQQQGLLARKYLCQLGQTNFVGIGGKVYRFLGILLSWYRQHRSNKSSGAFMKCIQVTVCSCKLWRCKLKGGESDVDWRCGQFLNSKQLQQSSKGTNIDILLCPKNVIITFGGSAVCFPKVFNNHT